MAFLKKNRALYVKPETSSGTFNDPLDRANSYANPSTLAIALSELDFTANVEFDNSGSKIIGMGDAKQAGIAGKAKADITYSGNYTPPEFIKDTTGDIANKHTNPYAEILKTAGLDFIEITDDTVNEAVYSYPNKYVFYPVSNCAGQTISQTVVDKNCEGVGIAYDVKGCTNDLTISADGVVKAFKMELKSSGGLEATTEISPTDMNLIKFDISKIVDTLPSRFVLTDISVKNINTGVINNFCANKFSLSTGNTASDVECQSSASGLLTTVITDKEPKFTFNPQMKKLSEFDFYKGLTQGELYEIKLTVNDKAKLDDSAFVPIEILIPRAQMVSSPITDDSGFLRLDIEFMPIINKDKVTPDVKFNADSTGTETAFDFTGTVLKDNILEQATYFIIFGEELTKTV